MEESPRSLYAAFDQFPSPKGAAIHIYHAAESLFTVSPRGLLLVLATEEAPAFQREPLADILRFEEVIPNFLERALAFRAWVGDLVKSCPDLRQIQFRDPWSGVALIEHAPPGCEMIYEVNGLPSIELPLRYESVPESTLAKIRAEERRCLASAHRILTPSSTIRDNLVATHVAAERITVIPNGADIPSTSLRPEDLPPRYILYFGATQPWQGIGVLLHAMARLIDLPDLKLVVCASTRRRTWKHYLKMAERLGIADRVEWRARLHRKELAPIVQYADFTVAPLTECSRNLHQGCSPLKILESMAAGTPVIASDLPAVRELVEDREDGLLVRPDRLLRAD